MKMKFERGDGTDTGCFTRLKMVFVLLISILLVSCYDVDGGENASNPIPIGPPVKGDHLAMGNPSSATNSIASADNYLMAKDQYALSYNNAKRTANWVSWHLSTAWIGPIDRRDDFRADLSYLLLG